MKKFKKSKESKNVKTVDEPITREEQEQYIRDVVAAYLAMRMGASALIR